MNWSDNILQFIKNLKVDENVLPEGIEGLYPFESDKKDVIERVTKEFYTKYYSDSDQRYMIIGINPGRLGAGATAIPFTDPKRLESHCNISIPEFSLHEPSSVFVYEVIDAYGGPKKFYKDFYITSVSSIGFVKRKTDGKSINYNYYDRKELADALRPFIIEKLREQIDFGANTKKAFCFGTGKNFKYLKELNKQEKLFGEIVPLEHPRYVMQYKNKSKSLYIDKFIQAFSEI